jgi:potassium-transporting ATPase potassium-binding subunit
MPVQCWLQIILTLAAIFLVSIPLGRYMARVVTGRPTKFDRIFDPIDNAIYFLIGRRVASLAMTWKTYTIHMLVTNLVMAVIIYLVLSFQNYLPLNQLNFPAVDPLLAFNTTISFITNTNWQAYGGESTLSNFSQMGAITYPKSPRQRQASSWLWPGFGRSPSGTGVRISAISIATLSGSSPAY